jgi:hypothetical protein
MAGAGFKTWAAGDVLTAAQLNTYIQEQTIGVFASAAARGSAITSPTEGMVTYRADGDALEFYNGAAWVAAGQDTSLSNVLITSPRETTTISATAAANTINFDAATQADLYYTSNATANFTLNIRASSSATLSSLLPVGQTITLVFRNTNGSTAYYPTAIQIDGTSVTPKWQGGTTPSAGNASSIDVYSFAITKTAATPSYLVLASQTKYA